MSPNLSPSQIKHAISHSLKQEELLSSLFDITQHDELQIDEMDDMEENIMDESIMQNQNLSLDDSITFRLNEVFLASQQQQALNQSGGAVNWRSLCQLLLKKQKQFRSQLQQKSLEVQTLRNKALHVANAELREQMERLDCLTNQLSAAYDRNDALERELTHSRDLIMKQRSELSLLRRDWYELRGKCREEMNVMAEAMRDMSRIVIERVRNTTLQAAQSATAPAPLPAEVPLLNPLRNTLQQQIDFVKTLSHRVRDLKSQHERLMEAQHQVVEQQDEQPHDEFNRSLMKLRDDLDQTIHSTQNMSVMSSATEHQQAAFEERYCNVQYVNTQLMECCEEQAHLLQTLKEQLSDAKHAVTLTKQIDNLQQKLDSLHDAFQMHDASALTNTANMSTFSTKSRRHRKKLFNTACIVDNLTKKCLEQRRQKDLLAKELRELKRKQNTRSDAATQAGEEQDEKSSSDSPDVLLQQLTLHLTQIESKHVALFNRFNQKNSENTDLQTEFILQMQCEQNKLKQLHQSVLESFKSHHSLDKYHHKLKKAYSKIHQLRDRITKYECLETTRQSQMQRMKLQLEDERQALALEKHRHEQEREMMRRKVDEIEEELQMERSLNASVNTVKSSQQQKKSTVGAQIGCTAAELVSKSVQVEAEIVESSQQTRSFKTLAKPNRPVLTEISLNNSLSQNSNLSFVSAIKKFTGFTAMDQSNSSTKQIDIFEDDEDWNKENQAQPGC